MGSRVEWATPVRRVVAGDSTAVLLVLFTSGVVSFAQGQQTPPIDIGSSVYNGRAVTYQVVDGLAIYQGDVVLGTPAQLEAARARYLPGTNGPPNPSTGAATVAFATSLWPPGAGGVAHVPYFIPPAIVSNLTAAGNINTAVSQFNSTFAGVIQWVPWSGEADYASFDLNPANQSGTCESFVGKIGGPQSMFGAINCGVAVLLHEMGHASGLWHEQSRLDRASYVTVLPANIDKPQLSNFDQVLSNEVDLGLYDYASLMHYSAFLFGKYGQTPTIESIPAGIPLSNTVGFSSGDVDAIQRLYGHAPTSVTIDTNPTGGSVIVDGALFSTPHAFAWPIGSTHTLALPADPVTINGVKAIFGRWNDAAGATASHAITVTAGGGQPYSPTTSPANTVVVANYIPVYPYSLSAGTSHGSATPTPAPSLTFNGVNYYANRQFVSLQATPAAGFGFQFWANVALFNLYANPNGLYVGGDMANLQPVFEPGPMLTLNAAAPGIPNTGLFPSIAINVTGAPSSPTFLPANFQFTAPVTLNGAPVNPAPVTPNISYAFSSWSDGLAQSHTVNPPAPGNTNTQTITATFTPSFRALVTPNPSCAGSISPGSNQMLQNGTSHNFQANPISGWAFVGWSGDFGGTQNPITVSVNDQLLTSANFNVTGTADPLTLAAFSPLSHSAGAFTLTISGTGFTPNTAVFWNNLFRQSSFVSSTQIRVNLTDIDTSTPGYYPVQVENFDAGFVCSTFTTGTYLIVSSTAPAALGIGKGHTGDFVQGQQNATYTVQVANPAGAGTTNGTVTVTETLPAGLTMVSMAGDGWVCPANGVTCTRSDSLAGGMNYPPITVTVNVAANAASQVSNQVSVSGGGSATATTTDPTTVTLPPAVSLTKSADAPFVSAGSPIGFSIQAQNGSAAGTGTATGVTLNDPLPAGTAINWSISPAYAGPGTCSITGAVGSQTLGCSLGDLAAGTSAPVHILSQTAGPGSCAVYSNTAALSATNVSSLQAAASTTVRCPNLNVTNTAGAATVNAGSPIGFAVAVSNSSAAGTGSATGVTLNDPLPAGAGIGWSISPAYSGPGTCSITGAAGSQSLVCNFGVMAPGASASVQTLSGTSTAGCAAYSSTAAVTANNSAQAQASATTTVLCASLGIAKTHSGNFAPGQSGAAYTVTVSNASGAGQTSGTVTVAETVPSGLTLVSMAGPGWTCPGTAASNCTRGDALAGGASYPALTVTVNVAANATSPQLNSVAVSGGGSANANTTDSTTIVGALRFIPVTPCRVADTRKTNLGAFGAPSIAGGASRDFIIPNGACSIPITAQAYSFNVAVVPPGPLGFLTLYPAGQTRPVASTLNSLDARTKSNAAIVPAGTGRAVSVFASNTTDVILDINGYFVPASNSAALAFYPVTPCRLVDTRKAIAPLAGPSLVGQQSRTLPILTGACNLPAAAQAYSLNLAAVPGGNPLGFVTAFPTGQTRPVAANLNALTGTVTANAAIVPAGANGAIDVFASNTTDLVIDVNGYFAPMNTGGLSLYGVTPCRILDTRKPPGSPPITQLDVAVSASACGIPGTAQAYVFSVAVAPPAALGFLTLWPQGQTRPAVATLNASDGAVTSNMALVPTTNGSISVFASNLTHLIMDISGYFGQ